MLFNYTKLRGKIREVFTNEGTLAKEMGISHACLSGKFNSKTNFTAPEIVKIIELLNIDSKEIPCYFFNLSFTNVNHNKE